MLLLLVFVLLATSVLQQREVSATVSSFYVSVVNTAMRRTSIAAVVLGCFYIYPLDCDASVMVGYGCWLRCSWDGMNAGKIHTYYFSPYPLLLLSFAFILLLLLLLRRDMHFCFLVEVLLLLIVFLVDCADAAAGVCAAYNISTAAERGTGYCFFLLRFCRLHCNASDVYCCCCSWLLLFPSFRLRYSGYGRWLRCCLRRDGCWKNT